MGSNRGREKGRSSPGRGWVQQFKTSWTRSPNLHSQILVSVILLVQVPVDPSGHQRLKQNLSLSRGDLLDCMLWQHGFIDVE